MENFDRLRRYLETMDNSGQRVTTLGEVPVGSEVTVAYFGRHGGVYRDQFTVTGNCQINNMPGVTTERSHNRDIKERFLAEMPCLV